MKGIKGLRGIGLSVMASMAATMGLQGRAVFAQIAAYGSNASRVHRAHPKAQQQGNQRHAGAKELARAARFYMQPCFPGQRIVRKNGQVRHEALLRAAPIMCRRAGV